MRLMVCQRTKRMTTDGTARHCQKWRIKRQLAADVDVDVDVRVFIHFQLNYETEIYATFR